MKRQYIMRKYYAENVHSGVLYFYLLLKANLSKIRVSRIVEIYSNLLK